MSSDDPELATYQEALLDVLARSHDAAGARTALLARAPVALAPYVADFDSRMLGLGIHLTEKWAKRC